MDILEVDEQYSVGTFVKKAKEVIEDMFKWCGGEGKINEGVEEEVYNFFNILHIVSRNKLPIIVGGSAMYIDRLISMYSNSSFLAPKKNEEIAKQIAESIKGETWDER